MSLHSGPIRPGSRGGRGEFSWENVKADPDASYYLGHSVMAPQGRWTKGRDVFWYTRGKDTKGSVEEERKAVKQKEEQLMMEALGLKPKSLPVEHQPMDQKELNAILKKNAPEKEEGAQHEAIKGLGFGPAAVGGGGFAARSTLEGVGMDGSAGAGPSGKGAGPSGMHPSEQQQRLPPPPPLPAGGGAAAAAAMGGVLTKDQIKQLAKVDKKAAKAAKKARRQAKKEAKKAKKEAKRQNKSRKRRSRSRSRSSSPASSSGGSGSSSASEGKGRSRSASPPPAAAAARGKRDGDAAGGGRERGVGSSRQREMRDDEGWEYSSYRGRGHEERGERGREREREKERGGRDRERERDGVRDRESEKERGRKREREKERGHARRHDSDAEDDVRERRRGREGRRH